MSEDVAKSLNLPHRPRRMRRTEALRRVNREHRLDVGALAWPVFVHDGDGDEPIASMPGQFRLCLDSLVDRVGEAASLGVDKIALFPKVASALKTPDAQAASDPEGLAPRAVRRLKRELPAVCVITDVALDPYSSDGHDGVVREGPGGTPWVANDATVGRLVDQALCQARAGADVIAPSDMMDGRIGAIRGALDRAGFEHVAILAYSAKYASALYGPFREALNSAPATREDASGGVPADKRGYQLDPANVREAVRQAVGDAGQGADLVMVKPAVAYLDVIRVLCDLGPELPGVAAYHVSGEYAMLKSAAAAGWLDERSAVLEVLTGIVRAGASLVLTYHAVDAARWLAEG